MESILEVISTRVQQLLGRAHGPLHFRLVVMPTMVTLLAIRAGLRDARAGRPAFLWALLFHPPERTRLVRSTARDIGKVLVVAVVLDSVYQLTFLHAFYPGQVLIVAMACAILPYVLVRGPVTRLGRRLYRGRAAPAVEADAKTVEEPDSRESAGSGSRH